MPFANSLRLFKRAHGHTTGIIGEVRAVSVLPDRVGRVSTLDRANPTARRLVAAFHAHPCHPSYGLGCPEDLCRTKHEKNSQLASRQNIESNAASFRPDSITPEEVQKQHIGFESDQLPVPSC